MAITVADLVAASSPGMGSFPTSPRKSAPVKPRREVDGKAVRKKLQATRDSQHRMLDELGIDPWSLYDDAGEVDTRRVDQVHAEIRERLKAAGVDVPENAGLSQYSKLYAGLDDAGKKKYKEYTKQVGDAGTGTGTGTGNGATLANGQKQAPGGGKPGGGKPGGAGPAPLNPREIVATTDVSTRNLGGGDATSDTQVDGLSDRNQTDTVSHLNEAARNKAAVLAIQANDARKDALQASKVNDEIRRRQAIRGAAEREENGKDYWRNRADRLKAERAERNYKNRIVNSASDWENLGRLRGNELDGKVLSDEDYNKEVAKLQKRAAALRTAEGRAGLSDSDLRDMSGFFKTVGKVTVDKETGAVTHANGKKFTPAQIEALTNRISKYEGIAKERQSATQAKVEAHQRQRMFDLREKYGLGDSRVFSDEDVERVHRERTGQQVKAALGETLDAFTNRDKGADGITKFSDSWMKLAKSGADLTGAFNEAMKDKEVKDWYMGKMAGASSAERDAFRQNVILNQLAKTYGVETPQAREQRMVSEAADRTAPLAAGFQASKVPPAADTAVNGPLTPREADTVVNKKFQAAGIRVPLESAETAAPGDVTKNDVDAGVEFPEGTAADRMAPVLRGLKSVEGPLSASVQGVDRINRAIMSPGERPVIEPRKKPEPTMLYAGGSTPIKPRTRR